MSRKIHCVITQYFGQGRFEATLEHPEEGTLTAREPYATSNEHTMVNAAIKIGFWAAQQGATTYETLVDVSSNHIQGAKTS